MPKRTTPREARKVRDTLDAIDVPAEFRQPTHEPAQRPLGRPPIRPAPDNPVALALLCENLAAGMSMEDACADERCPASRTVYTKMAADPSFSGIIARAREAQQHAIIDETVRMADAATVEDWQVVRMRIWARQWRAGKLSPKVYGEKVDVNHGGSVDVRTLTEDALSARITELAGKAGIGDAAGGTAPSEMPPRPDGMVH